MSPGKPASEHIIPVQCAVFGWKYVESGSMTREDSMTHNRREWGELHRGGGIWVFKNKLEFQDRGDIAGCTMQGECHFFRQKVQEVLSGMRCSNVVGGMVWSEVAKDVFKQKS